MVSRYAVVIYYDELAEDSQLVSAAYEKIFLFIV